MMEGVEALMRPRILAGVMMYWLRSGAARLQSAVMGKGGSASVVGRNARGGHREGRRDRVAAGGDV